MTTKSSPQTRLPTTTNRFLRSLPWQLRLQVQKELTQASLHTDALELSDPALYWMFSPLRRMHRPNSTNFGERARGARMQRCAEEVDGFLRGLGFSFAEWDHKYGYGVYKRVVIGKKKDTLLTVEWGYWETEDRARRHFNFRVNGEVKRRREFLFFVVKCRRGDIV